MTPRPSFDELVARSMIDFAIGFIHVKAFIAMMRDGIYNKDRPCDYLIGWLLVAVTMGFVTAEEISFLQEGFVEGGKPRYRSAHLGSPFLDHNGDVMRIQGRLLQGHGNGSFAESAMTLDGFITDARFNTWATQHLFAGGSLNCWTYVSTSGCHTKVEVDALVNHPHFTYTPGPNTIATGTYGSTPRTCVTSSNPVPGSRRLK